MGLVFNDRRFSPEIFVSGISREIRSAYGSLEVEATKKGLLDIQWQRSLKGSEPIHFGYNQITVA